jgi:hypothetical protein
MEPFLKKSLLESPVSAKDHQRLKSCDRDNSCT